MTYLTVIIIFTHINYITAFEPGRVEPRVSRARALSSRVEPGLNSHP